MKLYDGGRAPNPRRVRIFLAEKGIDVPLESIDMGTFGHKSPELTARNPMQRLPVLELGDGTVIAESVAICRYFEELYPEPPLFGIGAVGRAITEMWQRRIELYLLSSVAAAFRHIHPAMKEWELPQLPEWGELNKPKALEFCQFLEGELANREFIAGDHYTIADITALVAVDFMKPAKIVVPAELKNLLRWHGAVSARPSAQA
ncbi:glutathione S-transferase [Tianweitania sediminis]|jgi:glutathione S-transferase|uniref:Glutathione S-transferase n=1 Tax=Tianweitania sediminis TaxID=1502156 RepID=A0A8J7UKJ0_9HYPH|nr:glutathione S-transferase [Tianweitania sediminis]MBP0439724.1 glutathione S-transferase [Tianweitania sediminis]HEV7415000.1 glutathione S-transferase [Tianweitania sediminis]